MTPEELHNIFRAETEFWWYHGMRDITRRFLAPLLPNRSMPGTVLKGLDAGCGTGFNAQDVESGYGIRMYGIDLAPLGIQYCRERNFDRSAAASVLELPFPDSSFEMVSAIDMLVNLHHRDHDRALQELVRVLRPGGLLVIRVAAFQALRSRHSQWTAERYRYRAPELHRKISAVGCTVVKSTYANFFLSPIAWLKFRIWENVRNTPPSSGVEQILPAWMNQLLYSVLKAEAAIIRRDIRLPFGQSLMVAARKPE